MISQTDSRDSEVGSGISLSSDAQEDQYVDGWTPSVVMDIRSWKLSAQDNISEYAQGSSFYDGSTKVNFELIQDETEAEPNVI